MSSGSETPSNRRTSRITSYLQVGTLLSCAFLLFGEHISYPLTDATRSVTYRLLLSDRPEGTEMSMELPEPIAAYFARTKKHDVDAMLAPFAAAAIVKDEGQERRGRAFTLAGDKISGL